MGGVEVLAAGLVFPAEAAAAPDIGPAGAAAVRAFIARYNAEWLIQKNGYLSPQARRRQHDLATMPMAA